MRVAPSIVLTELDQATLERWAGGRAGNRGASCPASVHGARGKDFARKHLMKFQYGILLNVDGLHDPQNSI